MKISICRLRAGSVFKIAYFSLLSIIVPFVLVFTINALFGGGGVTMNGHTVTGWAALMPALLLIAIWPLLVAGVVALGFIVARLVFKDRLQFELSEEG